jgi:hypothetical protein
MYTAAFDAARDQGLRWVSLGNDPTLFGHTVAPGLFGFKARLGFVPIPTQALFPGTAGDEAELVVHLRRLADPSLSIAYGATEAVPSQEGLPASPPLHAVVLSAVPNPPEPAWLPRCPIPVTHRVISSLPDDLG